MVNPFKSVGSEKVGSEKVGSEKTVTRYFEAGNNLCHFLKIRFVVWNRSLKSSTGAWIAPLSHLHIRIQLDEFRVGVMGKFEMA
ncbi:MAG: hypothetical protein B6240_01210 [Desulfobacteraceae bacterium 4572_87]|nr:MAG: hypothetical protein B6240_01210 [Desulfobacteraceae bacterium 4572_87]